MRLLWRIVSHVPRELWRTWMVKDREYWGSDW